MKKALVLGASGGMGYSIVKELTGRGIDVIAFSRTKSTLDKLFGDDPGVTVFVGDVFNIKDLETAAAGVDVIFHSANIPYPEWKERLAPLMANVLQTAKNHSARLAVVDNIYAYGRSNGEDVTETVTKNPHTKKGKIRLKVETMVKESGVEALIAHFPDFYGPNAHNTLLGHTLQSMVNNKSSVFVGGQKIAREFIYTPDGAKAIVTLALTDSAYGQNWNIPASGVITGEEIVEIVKDLTKHSKRVSTVSKNMIRLIGLFNPMMREAVEMYYLNEKAVVLSGQKYENNIGPIPRTSYREGLNQTIEYMNAVNCIRDSYKNSLR